MLIPYEQALRKVLSNTKKLTGTGVPVTEAAGHVLTEDVFAGIAMPPFDKSAMDGYALKAIDVKNAPVELKNIGVIQAGQYFRKKVRRGQCVKIMTGAALPEGADTVVKVEDVYQKNGRVRINGPFKKGTHVCQKAQDVRKGQLVKRRGTVIEISDVGILAGVGRDSLRVVRRPSIALLNTGGEIVQPGKSIPNSRQIYNSNGPQLLALLKSDGFESVYLGTVRDQKKDLKQALKKGLQHDVVIVTGGVSKGDFDLVPDMCKHAGVNKIFHGVWVKPGKPLFFGKRKDTLVFGVPGNPVSSFLVYQAYVRPALFKMMGRKDGVARMMKGVLTKTYRQETKRRHFVPVKIVRKGTQSFLKPVECQGSADMMALSKADGFMMVRENTSAVRPGSRMEFVTWKLLYD